MKEPTIFKFDMTAHIGADGRLTEDGAKELAEEMRAQFRTRFPTMAPDALEKAVAEVVRGIAGKSPVDVNIQIKSRALTAQFDRARRMTDGCLEQLTEIAQLFDLHKEQSGPHILACGQAIEGVNTARQMLQGATHILENMLTCGACFDDTQPGDEPMN